MSREEPRVDRSGIHIDRELAESVAIEEELDANLAGVYRFPSPERRRLSAWVYLAMAALALVAADSWIVAAGLAALGIWHFLSAWPLAVDETAALRIAGSTVDFPVGHASVAVRFKGWRSRPRWAVVLYSASDPPDQRALVVVDAIAGEVVENYREVIGPV
jgi:predicted alpha/beta hydrolase family esterase